MRIKYIDVLKAFAIIAVVLYHTGLVTYGYLGVDLFLVVSGYWTTKNLYNKFETPYYGGWRRYFDFELSRIVRLLPPILFAGIFCMLLGFFIMLPDDYENLSQSVIATNFFGNNILSAITTKNYWDVVNDYKPLMHTWYVGVVMQFFLVFPLLFFFAKIDKYKPKKTLLLIIAVLAFISLLVYFSTIDTAQRFYFLPSRFFEFAVGGIAALVYNPQEDKPFRRGFVYGCYVLLLVLMFANVDLLPSNVRLVVVVALSCILICSQDVLENRITGNALFAKIGAASYSIFIWHQILLAFYRYSITNKFTIFSYALLFVSTALMSWLSFRYIEQYKSREVIAKHRKMIGYSLLLLFIGLNIYAGHIYLNAGVVRDVPELYISKNNVHRGMHAEYVDRGYKYDHPFSTDKKHWYVIGNSFGRDFINIILESSVSDKVEISYSTAEQFRNESSRFAESDYVFISILGLTEDFIREVEIMSMANGLPVDKVIIVGEKNFGVSNGQFYTRRKMPDYFDQCTNVEDYDRYVVRNKYFAKMYGKRYLDLLSMVSDDNDKVRVFTPDHHFMSADCRHLSKGGAVYLASRIDWNLFL